MLDILGILFFTFSTLSLLGIFPIGIYEFLDLREGFAISDYGTLFETSTFFSITAIITGLLCGLDAITNPIYKKVDKLLYNYHALSSFALLGIGLFPLTGLPIWTPQRALHWLFAFTFLFVYPITRILIVRKLNKSYFPLIGGLYLLLCIGALLVSVFTQFKFVAYPEYLLWVAILISIVFGKIILLRKLSK
jgi:hypothetical membrane protein